MCQCRKKQRISPGWNSPEVKLSYDELIRGALSARIVITRNCLCSIVRGQLSYPRRVFRENSNCTELSVQYCPRCNCLIRGELSARIVIARSCLCSIFCKVLFYDVSIIEQEMLVFCIQSITKLNRIDNRPGQPRLDFQES